MKYRISEIARLFGVSTETIRYYEKVGLIKGVRDRDNNYRYYDNWDIFDLGNYITYKNFNFTFEETKKVLNSANSDALCGMLDSKIGELNEKIAREKILLEWMRLRLQDIRNTSLNLGRIVIQEYPEMRLTEMFQTSGDQMNVNILDNINQVSFGAFGVPVLKTNLTKIKNADANIERGRVFYKWYLDALHMELSPVCAAIPKQTYITYSAAVENLDHLPDIVGPLLDAVEQEKYAVKNELYGMFEVRLNVDEKHIRYIRFMIPLK